MDSDLDNNVDGYFNLIFHDVSPVWDEDEDGGYPSSVHTTEPIQVSEDSPGAKEEEVFIWDFEFVEISLPS